MKPAASLAYSYDHVITWEEYLYEIYLDYKHKEPHQVDEKGNSSPGPISTHTKTVWSQVYLAQAHSVPPHCWPL